MRLRVLSFLMVSLFAACTDRPSRAEALAAFRAARPGVDSADAVIRVWADGPPWFSCAEVLAKLKGNADRDVVRDDIGHWRTLITADWITLRDTTAGPVVDPGWCRVHLHVPEQLTVGWRPVRGDSLPSGGERSGWDVVVGKNAVNVAGRTTPIGRDSARADYAIIVVPNQNGVATGADHDTVQQSGVLARVDGQWRVVRWESVR